MSTSYTPARPHLPHPQGFRHDRDGLADRVEEYCGAITAADRGQPDSFVARVVTVTRPGAGGGTHGYIISLDSEHQARSLARTMLAELDDGLRLTVEPYQGAGGATARVVVTE